MASPSQLFSISYRTLLASIVAELDWSEPIYNSTNAEPTGVYVLLSRSNSPIAYFFSVISKATRVESEEDAAEQAVDYLVQKGRVIVDDVNVERRRMYKACARFYKDKSTCLELIQRVPARNCVSPILDLQNQPLGNKPKMVSIDFWSLLLQIVDSFELSTTEVEELVYDNDFRVCTLRINWDNSYNKVSYFIGECCPTLQKAKQSLAKKIILYLQTLLGFGVKDANYYGMIYAEMRAGVHRQRYLAAKHRLDLEVCALSTHSDELCITPDDVVNQINTGMQLPPPPKKPKTIWREAASSSTNKDPMYKITSTDMPPDDMAVGISGIVQPLV